MRLFIAIELDAAVRHALWTATAAMREAAPTVRWTAERSLHLTLRFLGEQPEALAERLTVDLHRVASRHAAFPIELTGLGAFPNRRRPRILWAGIAAEPRLELLYHDVALACDAVGLSPEGRAFRPHVTIGRADRAAPAELAGLDRAARAARVALTSHVTSVDLMRSELTPGGARHSRIAAARLGA